MARDDERKAEQRFDDLLRRALKTPPISNEEIERRSKGARSKPRPK
jgi:hypothetical protein